MIELSRSANEAARAAARGQAATAALTGPIQADAVAQEVLGGAVIARLEFDLRDTSWASDRTLSASLPGPQGGAAPVTTPSRRVRNARPGLN